MVLTDSFFEEVRFALERYHVHPFEGIFDIVVLWYTKGEEKAVGNEFNILVHKSRIHSNQFDGQRVSNKVTLNVYGLRDDLKNTIIG